MKDDANLGNLKVLCYLGIFVLLLFIILPPLFRVLFPEEEMVKEQEEEKLIMNLTCVKTEDFVEYKIKTTVDTDYINSVIDNSTFTYEIEIVDDLIKEEGIEIKEYEELKKVSNVDFNEEDNKRILNINYSKFNYDNEPLLANHKKLISEQLAIYTENHFECKTTKVQ